MRKNTFLVSMAFSLLLSSFPSVSAYATTVAKTAADSPAKTSWIYPVIKGFGKVHPRPEAAVQPDPSVDYKVIVDVVSGDKDHSHVLQSLQRLARTVNLLGYAKVPPNHVHIVAVLEGPATFAATNNALYRQHFKVDNPNLAILHALKQSGVQLLICSQAMAELDIKPQDLGPDITMSLSALTDFVVYGQRGYSFMQL